MLFRSERVKSLKPADDFTGSWLESVPENVANFSATAYFFGRMVQQAILKQEALAVFELQLKDILREIYFDENHCAALILE